ncbi:hypothetical protein LCGC14_1498520, partial [marine sediment metagenome]
YIKAASDCLNKECGCKGQDPELCKAAKEIEEIARDIVQKAGAIPVYKVFLAVSFIQDRIMGLWEEIQKDHKEEEEPWVM